MNETGRDYLPALDGVRGIAIALVAIAHAGFENRVPGLLGVILFFVLSGFLITRQLMNELTDTGSLRLARFYWRRSLRLAPPLLFYLLLLVPFLTIMGAHITLLQSLSAVFYFANYYHIFIGYPPLSPFPILWSLSVEEHFYIIFPLALLWLSRRSASPTLWFAVAALLAFIWRLALFAQCHRENGAFFCGFYPERRLQGTDAIFDTILYGALLATAALRPDSPLWRRLLKSSSFHAAVAALVLSLIIRNPFFRETLRPSLQSAAVAVILAHVISARAGPLHAILTSRLLVGLGKISYSLYLFHYGALVALHALSGYDAAQGTLPYYLCYFGLSGVLSFICWYGIERPMQLFRRRTLA